MKRSPLKPKRSKPRRTGPTCSHLRCKRRPTAGELCVTHAKLEADKLCRQIVLARDGRCISCHTQGESSPLQWAHVLSRRALCLRWLLEPPGSFALCAGCHYGFTMDPPAWQDFVDEYRPGLWEELRKIRREAIAAGDKVDYEELLAELRRLL